jgi:hypothetical protein
MRYKLCSSLMMPRPFARFSLAGLFIAISVVCAVLGWVANNKGNKRHRTIMRLQRPGIGLFFEHQGAGLDRYYPNARPPGSALKKRLFGEFSQARVFQIEAHPESRFTDADAKEITVFQELDWLAVSGSRLTDRGLRHLESMVNLGRLDIEECAVTQQGVARLRLALPNTKIYSDFDNN